jgi:hypothetical protein
MRFNFTATWSTLTNTFIFSTVALLSLIPAANADSDSGLNPGISFAAPGGPGSPPGGLYYPYTATWYVPREETER